MPAVAALLCCSILMSLAVAQSNSLAPGLTVTFAPDGQSCATLNNASNFGVSFHVDVSQSGGSGVCLNLRDIYSARNATQSGTTNNSAAVNDSSTHPNGAMYAPVSLNWASYGGNNYDPNANYTNIWYYQLNQTGTAFGSGAYGQFKLDTYPMENCAFGNPALSYRYTCQSSQTGQCNIDSQGIRSFGIISINQSDDGCYIFQRYPNSGSRVMGGKFGLLLGAVAMLVAFVGVM